MNKIGFFVISCLIYGIMSVHSQSIKLDKSNLTPVNVFISSQEMEGEEVIRVVKDPAIEEFDEATFARVKNVHFTNGTIEVKVLSRLLPDAPDFARGFIGLVFRVNDDNSKFESIYVRPTNARAEDQIRRNRTVQYFSYPDFKFQQLREEFPEMYESYTDMTLNEWINLRIEVEGEKAKLYINNNPQPSLIVNDLKLGNNAQGAIGMFVDVGTEGFFKDLKIY